MLSKFRVFVFSDFGLLVTATGLAGVLGYVLNILVKREVSDSSFVEFAIFWGALYLGIGLLSGIQQEVTRSSSRNEGDQTSKNPCGARPFHVALATIGLIAVVLAVISLVVLPHHYFGPPNLESGLILFCGLSGYAIVALISGLLYGANNAVKVVALMIVSDVLLRLIFVGSVATFGYDAIAMEVAICLPFILVPAFVFPITRKYISKNFAFDVSLGKFFINSIQTMAAAGAMSLLISGFPLVIRELYFEVQKEQLASIIFVVTLARAPLIVIAMSLQSYLIAKLRKNSDFISRLRLISLGVFIASLILGALLSVFGNQVFSYVADQEIQINGLIYLAVGISSGVVAVLFVIGAKLLAEDAHFRYLCMWLVTVIVTLAFLFFELEPGFLLSLVLIAPPLVGLLVGTMPGITKRKNKVNQ